ncbi:radical SAM protein [Opitutaceae bacterium TAV4]|nr:radical SAM protein [Opitutaceae bacterium TAV4]RRJ98576.1 radical SAM protein [Opitutaceae bacterium TAV3]
MPTATTTVDRYFARTGVDPLTSAFDLPALPPRGQRRTPPTASAAPTLAPESDPVVKMKAAMPAHAIRIFDALQAAKDDPVARAAIEATLPPHALRALASLEEAMKTASEKENVARASRPLPLFRSGRDARATFDAPAARTHEWADVVAGTTGGRGGRALAIYVHFPFCGARCSFCPFYRYADPADWRPYRDALLREIDLAAAPLEELPDIEPARAVYFGGGTPSDLPGEALAELIARIRERLPVADDAEITIEGRPSSFDGEKIAVCRAAGATRFSLGVQTFDGGVRRAVGRRLDTAPLIARLREIGAAAGRAANGEGGAPVIVDLIYGLPGQTDASWERDLETVIAERAVSGVDLYRLKIFPGSPLARQAEAGGGGGDGRRVLPATEAEMARRFARGEAVLREAGWTRLSRWHWARPGAAEASVYNRLAKGEGDIVPLGCGAGGRWQRHGFVNTPGLDGWFAAVGNGSKPCLGWREPGPEWEELLSAQIETCRLAPAAWRGVSGEARREAGRLLEQWRGAGLVTTAWGGEWPLTVAGQYWSDRLLHALQNVLGKS